VSVGVAGVAGMAAPAQAAPAAGERRADETVGPVPAAADTPHRVYANNVGYNPAGRKYAVITGVGDKQPPDFRLIDLTTGKTAAQGHPRDAGFVKDWDKQRYWIADFTPATTPGDYVLAVGGAVSAPFKIEANVLERYTLAHVVHYFKGTRCSGQFDKVDHKLSAGDGGDEVDIHGGWYDATGDFGKHFTQLSQLSYFNTLQIPLTAWTLLVAQRELSARKDADFTQLETWLLDEGLYGADYLKRSHVSGGSFYGGVIQPGPPKIPTKRSLDGSQVDFREGGGVAIAALALASTCDVSGDFRQADYLAAAEDAFTYLLANNVGMTNDGKENIQDDYNMLLAATELFRATKKASYRKVADGRAKNLMGRLASWRGYHHYWRADEKDRPFFHPSDAGMPVVSLLTYADIASAATRKRLLEIVRSSLEYELAVTAEVANPFGYARQLVQDASGRRFGSFFFPHNLTPRTRDLWWQGENARIASLAAAARFAARFFTDDKEFAWRLRGYASDQLNWILGVNPFDVCMLDGSGRNNPQYIWLTSWQFLPTAGGIVNGITGKNDDGSGILWNRGYAVTHKDDDWRWGEQWLPHSTWYLHAVVLGD
jgi:hypothetical protein